LLTQCLAELEAETLEHMLLNAGVPTGVVRNVSEALAHPHTIHRNMVVKMGNYSGTGIPALFGRTPGSIRSAPPSFGQDSRCILLESGYSEAQIAQMEEQAIVFGAGENETGQV
jgi:formyl-CoA transferase